jgi:hypothetical protein
LARSATHLSGVGMKPKTGNEPHAKRMGWLKNGNPVGDLGIARRCCAKTRKGTPCQSPAMRNGRCRMHGGASTGPRTPAGLARSSRANWKHGLYSQQAKQEARLLKQFLGDCKELWKDSRAERADVCR